MRIKQDLLTRQFVCAPNKNRDRTRKKSASSNQAHNLRIGAKKLGCALAKLFALHPLNAKVIAYSFCYREQKKEI
jgi:hypothetical protein